MKARATQASNSGINIKLEKIKLIQLRNNEHKGNNTFFFIQSFYANQLLFVHPYNQTTNCNKSTSSCGSKTTVQ
jgi:hypothetical protein